MGRRLGSVQKLIPVLLEGIWLAGEARRGSIPEAVCDRGAIPRPRIRVNLMRSLALILGAAPSWLSKSLGRRSLWQSPMLWSASMSRSVWSAAVYRRFSRTVLCAFSHHTIAVLKHTHSRRLALPHTFVPGQLPCKVPVSAARRLTRMRSRGTSEPKPPSHPGQGDTGPSASFLSRSSISGDTLPPAGLASGPVALPPKPEVIFAQTLGPAVPTAHGARPAVAEAKADGKSRPDAR